MIHYVYAESKIPHAHIAEVVFLQRDKELENICVFLSRCYMKALSDLCSPLIWQKLFIQTLPFPQAVVNTLYLELEQKTQKDEATGK